MKLNNPPTILSEHGEGSDELYTWCVHGHKDHAVLAMPKKKIKIAKDFCLIQYDHFGIFISKFIFCNG